jgi:putative RNA 2'-phosphotransferase
MLKECSSHGYFRGELCPVCGSESRFLLNDQEVEFLVRTMAGVLRHFPERFGVTMDKQGWIDMGDFITALSIKNRRFKFIKPHHIIGLVETDAKGRYQYREGKIRATYGHSLEVELDLPTHDIPEILYYPTTPEECNVLLGAGLMPADRKMVHLSSTPAAAMEAGKVRVENPVILAVAAKKATENGVVIMKAGKTVYTTKEMPAEFLSRYDVSMMEKAEEELSPDETE